MGPREKAAGIFAAAAIVVIFYAVTNNGHGTGIGCTLSAAAVGTMVTELSKGHDTRAILAPTASGIAVPVACKRAVDALVSDPAKQVTLTVTDPVAGTSTATTDRATLLAPPRTTVPPGTANVTRAFRCLAWNVSLLTQMCLRGDLAPPAG